ncbi:hypothetical protein Dimus_008741 [Dionaea muscipula]
MFRERGRGSTARTDGGWIPVLRRSSVRSASKSQGGVAGLITIFVDDLPDSMVQTELYRMFAKFGVVKDAFIPRKRNKMGRRFGFVRFDCSVAAEVAIKQTNGIWVQDKELKVKSASYARQKARGTSVKGFAIERPAGCPSHNKSTGFHQRHSSGNTTTKMGIGGGSKPPPIQEKPQPLTLGGGFSTATSEGAAFGIGGGFLVPKCKSYAEAVRRGKVLNDSRTSAKGIDIRGSRVPKESRGQGLMQHWPSANTMRLGKNQGRGPFWKGKIDTKQVRKPVRRDLPLKGIETIAEVAIRDIGTQKKIPTVRVETIGNGWLGGRLIDDDTAKGARFDVGKVKIFTQEMSAINRVMHLMVGSKLYSIRVAEEQAVFICNLDFRCGCTCHGKEDEGALSQVPSDDDDDVAEDGEASSLNRGDIDSRSFIAETQEVGEENGVGDESVQGAAIEASRGYDLIPFDDVNPETRHLETSTQARARQNGSQISGPGIVIPSRGLDSGPDIELGHDSVYIGGPAMRTNLDDLRCTNLNLDLAGYRGIDALGQKNPSEECRNTIVEPVVMSRTLGESAFRPEGINLEVVLVGDISSTSPELQEGRPRADEGHCVSMDGRSNPRALEVTDLAITGSGTEADRQLQADVVQQINHEVQDKPRKRGRPPKKKKVILSAATLSINKSTSMSSICGQKKMNDESINADSLWKFGKKLGLVSAEADTVVVRNIERLLAELGKGKTPTV